MIDGTFAFQISREKVPDFATANIEIDNIFDFENLIAIVFSPETAKS